GHVTARYQVVGHDLNMTMAEFKASKANGTIEKEIIKRAEGKVHYFTFCTFDNFFFNRTGSFECLEFSHCHI
ncbi:hypothetical protein PT100_08850, partial [Erysipelothrix rhusiopathiae]|nr:hypothetical protein [Erysipelothrix rhusiopathiae]